MSHNNSMNKISCFADLSEADLCEKAESLAPHIEGGDMVLLSGSLGVGKTVFSRALIRALTGHPDLTVPSPTFALMQDYQSSSGAPILHLDLYRLKQQDDVFDLGVEDDLGTAIILVEWPGLLPSDWTADALHVHLETDGETHRRLTFSGGRRWQKRLEAAGLK